MKLKLAVMCFLFFTVGCSAFRGESVRELGEREKQVFDALRTRLTQNAPMMRNAATTMGNLGADYAEKEFELELALAKAKRLESMTAPWNAPRDDMAATQRAVVLYHLYELELAEQKVLQSRMEKRRADAAEVLAAYNQFSVLLSHAQDNMKIVLQYLNQPKSARIRAFTATFLDEVTAFREGLQASENPRLKELAEDVARYEEMAQKAKEQADEALTSIFSTRGR